uniref:Cadherin domain-containing protein n=1 Tax=Macrostomum lignano TaxID=282301 RepID=A0A1I8JHG3_9PLAT
GAAYFNLDPLTGLLRLARSLSALFSPGSRRQQHISFKLHLEASDQGEPRPLRRTSFIKVCVFAAAEPAVAGGGGAAAGAKNHAADDRQAEIGGGDSERDGGSSNSSIGSEFSSLIVLLVASLAILVLLILILTVVFLFFKRRGELRSQRDAAAALKSEPPAYDQLGKLPGELTVSPGRHAGAVVSPYGMLVL